MNLYLISLSELWHCVCRNNFLCEYIGNHHIEILTCTISKNTDRSTLEPYTILLCGSLLQDRLYLRSYFKYISLSDELKQHTGQARSGLSSSLAQDIKTC